MDFRNSRTYQNLVDALHFELTSKALYDIYSVQALREEYVEISRVYDIFSRNDLEHARIWMRILNGGTLPNTLENLEASVQRIGGNPYGEYALIAREEGYDEIASLFGGMGIIDANQDTTFDTFINEINTNQVFCKEEETLWICQACGNIMAGECAPEICPVCGYPQGYYRVFDCVL